MEIKAVRFRKNGFYTQPFVFGGEEGPQNFDPKVRYRGSLQNYLIDTGDEVILVDTGLPAGQTRTVRSTRAKTFAVIWKRSPRSAISQSRSRRSFSRISTETIRASFVPSLTQRFT